MVVHQLLSVPDNKSAFRATTTICSWCLSIWTSCLCPILIWSPECGWSRKTMLTERVHTQTTLQHLLVPPLSSHDRLLFPKLLHSGLLSHGDLCRLKTWGAMLGLRLKWTQPLEDLRYALIPSCGKDSALPLIPIRRHWHYDMSGEWVYSLTVDQRHYKRNGRSFR